MGHATCRPATAAGSDGKRVDDVELAELRLRPQFAAEDRQL